MATKTLIDEIEALPPERSPDAGVWPHASLEGFTPVEVYYGILGHLPRHVPFELEFLDAKHQAFPLLVPKAA